jgi:hypothetical protein
MAEEGEATERVMGLGREGDRYKKGDGIGQRRG